jgi:hypothetical protein
MWYSSTIQVALVHGGRLPDHFNLQSTQTNEPLSLAGNVGFSNVKKWLNRQSCVCRPDMSATRPKTVSAEVLTMSSRHVTYGYVGNMSA